MQTFSVSDADVTFCFFRLVCKSTVRAIGLKKRKNQINFVHLIARNSILFYVITLGHKLHKLTYSQSMFCFL